VTTYKFLRQAAGALGTLALVSTLSLPARAEASTLDLTTAGTSGYLGTAYFSEGGAISGTGVFPAFVRIGPNNTTTAAYNTTINNVLDNGASNIFNHQIQSQ
jgi:hypothetical protein